MADLISMLAAVAGSGGGADPNFNQTVLLLHGDGTNGAQNNTFLDSSTNNFTITRNGNTTQGTFSPFSVGAGEWSNYFDGTGDYLSIPSNTAFAFGTGAYTVEAWIYLTGFDSNESVVFGSASAAGGFGFVVYPTGAIGVAKYGTGLIAGTGTGVVSLNTWIHIAVSRSSTLTNGIKFFVNGSLVTTTTDAENWSVSSSPIVGGWSNLSTYDIIGYLSNVRVVKGRAVYDSAFTPSTAPLGATSGGQNPPQGTETSLLTCQSNRFVDNSTNAFAITRNGDVKVTPFSPFAPTAAYSAGTNGGSGYFDGTGDYLSIADNAAFEFGSGDFCVELFAYVNAFDSSGTVFVAQWNSPNRGWVMGYVNSGTIFGLSYSTTGSNEIATNSTVTFPLNQWNHLVACRSGNTLSTYLNGVRNATRDVTGVTIFAPNQALEIGRNAEATTAWEMNGYISNLRIVKGSSPYDATQTTLTIPTSPLTAIANTSVLLNYTNAGIFDNTGKNNLETVGNAQIDTTTKKYGTGSLEFDGTGDRLFYPNNPINVLGTGDYTIEFWVYANSWTSTPVLLEYGRPAATGTPGLEFYISNSSGKLDIYGGASTATLLISAGSNISATTWTHVALTRASGSTKLFLNGTQTGSTATDTTNYTQATVTIGAFVTGTLVLNGYIDDLRITKGIARYTANFVPPTAAFPNE